MKDITLDLGGFHLSHNSDKFISWS